MKFRFTAALLFCLLTPLIAGAENGTTGSPPYSGFLKTVYPKLQASTEQEGLWSYIDSSRDFKPYTKLMFEPVKFYNPPYQTGNAVETRKLYEMRNEMFAALTKPFNPGYELVDRPGPGVLRVRVSVFGVDMVKPDWKLGDNIPIKKVLDLASGGQVVPVMTAEMEVLDAEGKTVAAAVAQRKGSKRSFKDDKLIWEDLQPIVDDWANGLRLKLDQLRGVSSSKN